MKKLYIFLIVLLFSICLTSCGDMNKPNAELFEKRGSVDTELLEEENSADMEPAEEIESTDAESSGDYDQSNGKSYWFPNSTEVQRVQLKSTYYNLEVPDEIDLYITHVASYPNGELYELRLGWENEYFENTNFDGWDRRNLGYFYVEEDSIYRVRLIEEEFIPLFDSTDAPARTDSITEDEDITAWSEGDFKTRGTLVCQDSPMKDKVGEEVKGFHEIIEIDGDCSIYRSYYNRVETDFYERFVWEKSKGLVCYYSGYGAGRMHIEITLINDGK